jgi:hypothetical protein
VGRSEVCDLSISDSRLARPEDSLMQEAWFKEYSWLFFGFLLQIA